MKEGVVKQRRDEAIKEVMKGTMKQRSKLNGAKQKL